LIVHEKSTWLRTLLMLRGSAITRIWPRLLAVTLVATGVTYLHERYGLLHTDLTVTPFSLIGLALGIFLGFRNNTSYDRFWEGRKLWGRVVNASRTLTRQILTLVGPPFSEDRPVREGEMEEIRAFHRESIYRLIAYVHSLRLHLRGQDRLRELDPFLEDQEIAELVPELNRPIALLQTMGERFRTAWEKGWTHPIHVEVLELSLTELAGVQGGCERIKATPIPFSYNILLHRIVFFYCFMLPFGLVNHVHYFSPLVTALVSYAFFGLDAVGDEIEDPFGEDANDLPLGAITRMIEVNLRQRLGEEDLPPLAQPVNHVLT
jgi:putative membrane protein